MLKPNRRHLCVLMFIMFMFPTPAMSDCHDTNGAISRADIKELLFEVAGQFLDQEKKAFNKDKIKHNIATRLRQAGINVKLVENKKEIKTTAFIKIRIHSIMLERQVYLCSAEIIRRLPSQKDCSVLKHSNVTSLVKHTPPLINDLIDQLLRDIQ